MPRGCLGNAPRVKRMYRRLEQQSWVVLASLNNLYRAWSESNALGLFELIWRLLLIKKKVCVCLCLLLIIHPVTNRAIWLRHGKRLCPRFTRRLHFIPENPLFPPMTSIHRSHWFPRDFLYFID